ncbi:DHA2 family efflux MFS transporter permease subunit [Tanticharoenia sakaeratensis]|uniref:Membrane transporter n=1 Tax=Tanticharoenia sakaeratensis NBRC 103193 TaxID=1231623 RepID=A0A0D6MR66_9PROT|nr:DHA2 family efflux MFS transporter permease subunit [Tanticharoenia sakaeratensis]GAN55768.1 membrane transporter [Tanticharoenia sakaeratensis NBRC 103193]GBQ18584.1 membrane transporter [Tanticharoenia sakaeratensis NBRC 103193]
MPPSRSDDSAVAQTDAGQGHGLAPGAWKIICVAAIGSFMAQLDATIVNVSLTSLARDLQASLGTIQWVMSGYLLALALALPLNGRLVDRIGSRAVYLWCFAAFTLSSALCSGAWSAGSLIAFRVLQGMSGGLLAPMAQMMVARVAGRQMPRVAGLMTMPVLLAPLLGPVVAGALLHVASWRWLFVINLPVGGIAFLLAARALPHDHAERRPRSLDLAGLATLSPALVLFLYAADHVGTHSGDAIMIASLILFGSYVHLARRKGGDALIDLRLLNNRPFRSAAGSMFLMNCVSFGGQMLIPIYLIDGCGLSPGRTGLLLAPLALGMMCTYPFMGRLTAHFGIRRLTGYGAVVALAGTVPLAFMAHGHLVVAGLLAALFLRGIGISAIGVPAMSAGYMAVPKRDLPMATTALNIVQRLGGPTGTTLCAAALGWHFSPAAHGHPADALVAAFIILCGLHGLLVFATRRLPPVLPAASS